MTYPNLFYLKYFVDAVELGSMSRSAEKNFVTHPAISRGISSLEEHLGVKLLEHRKKQFKVTAEGYRVAEQAKELLIATENFQSRNLKSHAATENLAVGISRSLTNIYLSPLLEKIQLQFPHASIHVRFGTTHELLEAVANQNVDLAITVGSQAFATLKQNVLSKGNFVLVSSNKKKWSASDFPSQPFLLTEPRKETEQLKKEYSQKYQKPLPLQFEVRSWEVVAQLAQQGLGIGLIPDFILKNQNNKALRIHKTDWFETDYEIYIQTLKTAPPRPIVEYALYSLDTISN